jgi:hypothetical protein
MTRRTERIEFTAGHAIHLPPITKTPRVGRAAHRRGEILVSCDDFHL